MSGEWRKVPAQDGRPAHYERDKGGGVIERYWPEGSEVRQSVPTVGTTAAVGKGRGKVHSRVRPGRRTRQGSPAEARSDVTIALTERAVRDMANLFTFSTGMDGLEAGAWLRGLWDGSKRVVVASATAANLVREKDHVQLDTSLAEIADLTAGWGLNAPVVGLVHSHPSRTTTPSEADLRSWRLLGEHIRGRDASERFAVGLIAVPGPDGGWTRPRYHGWIVEDGQVNRAKVTAY